MSTDLSRRSFFRGVVATVAASSLVVEATPAEVAQFSKGAVIEGHEVKKERPRSDVAMIYIKNHDGNYIPYGFVDEITFERERLDVTAFGANTVEYRLGAYRWEGHFKGYGPLIREHAPQAMYYNGYPVKMNLSRWDRVDQDWHNLIRREHPEYFG